MRAQRVGIFRDFGKAGGRDHVGIAHCRLVCRAVLRLDQLHQPEPAAALFQALERTDFEALDEHRIGRRDAEFAQFAQQQIDHVDARILQQEFGVLQFGIEPDAAARCGLLGAHQLHDFGKGRHLIQPVKPRIGRAQRGDALFRAQGAKFGEGEVLGKPARDALSVDDLVAAAILEFRAGGDIGGARQLVLVARDEHEVFRHYQIGLDIIRPLIDRAFIGGEGMLGPLGARPAVGDDEHVLRGGGSGSQ